jgi:hypothetical protein
MRRPRTSIAWLAALAAVVAAFFFRHALYVWLLRLHGIHQP